MALLSLWMNNTRAMGGHPPWQYLLLSLAMSGVFLLGSRQDRVLGTRLGEFFSLFMAALALVAMLAKAVSSGWWLEALASLIALAAEVWTIKKWHTPKKDSP